MPRRNRNVRERNVPRAAQRLPRDQAEDTLGTHSGPPKGPHHFTVPTVHEMRNSYLEDDDPLDTGFSA